MNSTSEDRLLGEYRLKELLSENSISRTWLAEQVSVARRVLVDELRPEQFHLQEEFMADVRAKAAVEHPLIGSVYEAVSETGLCFYAHELLPGTTLEDRRKASAAFRPIRLAQMLRRISEAHLQHEALGQSTSPLELGHIHLDNQGGLRMDNLAIAGARTPEESVRDVTHLGERMNELVADSQPGSTRLLTLLAWMSGKQIEKTLTWEQVREISEQIEHQLTEPPPPSTPTQAGSRPGRKPRIAIITIASALAVIAIIILYLKWKPETPEPPPKINLTDAILIPGGNKPTPDGTEENLHAFRISAQEVTIGQYVDFLDTLETLSKNHRERTFDHENQPPEKTNHQPDDWPALLAAAKIKGTWNARPVSLDSPVVGVDWWDCAAYAEWKQARLPSQEEWFAALHKDLDSPAAIKPAGWIQVTVETMDRTPAGLVGMAGSVCEWTRRPAANPANPLGDRKWVIIGGSFLKPGSNALTREWTDDRSLRRSDLGFRIVSDSN
jgi:hypothetical protein